MSVKALYDDFQKPNLKLFLQKQIMSTKRYHENLFIVGRNQNVFFLQF